MDAVSVTFALATLGFAGVALWLGARVRAGRERLAASQAEIEALRDELTSARAELKSLSGLLPMCAWCKKIRDDAGYWQQVEGYLSSHTDAQFSHAMCPECFDRMQADMPDARWRI